MKVVHFLTAAFLSVMVLAGTASFGQERHHPDAKTMTDSMKSKLSLSDDQYSKVYNINQQFSDDMSKVKTDNGDKTAKREQARKAYEQRDAELKKVLTDDQYKMYKNHEMKMKKRMDEHRQKKAASTSGTEK
ncbi:hypothetical protein ACDQ55_09545 [Chitinophaga sp. 30R24]|uniref:hypothetical protein n=1 Tax=Chitinophaga sp. 30R24 TaxID=3248838 RepID=UPI003B8F2112